MVDGRPLYAGMTYDAGLREDRITRSIIEAAGRPDHARRHAADPARHAQQRRRDDAAADSWPRSRTLDDPTGAPADVAAYVAGLSPDDEGRARVREAAAR